jgi:hypothetical protein
LPTTDSEDRAFAAAAIMGLPCGDLPPSSAVMRRTPGIGD